MTKDLFKIYSDSVIKQMVTLRDCKGMEYAGTEDQFGNFNRLAAKLDLDRNKVWQVYFTKHMDAIESYIRTGRTFSTEPIQGRIIDAMTYLLLLGGMIREDDENGAQAGVDADLLQEQGQALGLLIHDLGR